MPIYSRTRTLKYADVANVYDPLKCRQAINKRKIFHILFRLNIACEIVYKKRSKAAKFKINYPYTLPVTDAYKKKKNVVLYE